MNIKIDIIPKLREWVASKGEDADKPFVFAGREPLTPRSVLCEVENDTPAGREFVEAWVDLALDHMLSAKME